MKVFALLGVSGMWGNQLFYILGLYYTSASVASCWQPAIPVLRRHGPARARHQRGGRGGTPVPTARASHRRFASGLP